VPAGLLRLGFTFVLLGYGTKAGLFPLHSWLPDAHSEAPAPASALLSGALLNCALVGLWRISGVLAAAGQQGFVQLTLLPLAVATVLAAGLMLLRQRDLKRMLAYSSLENVGLMAVAIALGQGSGLALQALNHSLVKVALFLLAGNLLQDYGSKALADIRGLQWRRPGEALLLFGLVLAVAGSPPFGSFLSEWRILAGAADGGHAATVAIVCAGLAAAFIALLLHVAGMLWGEPPTGLAELPPRAEPGRLVVPAALLAGALALGVALAPGLLAAAEGVRR
jgi:hydrogenase-4 component F